MIFRRRSADARLAKLTATLELVDSSETIIGEDGVVTAIAGCQVLDGTDYLITNDERPSRPGVYLFNISSIDGGAAGRAQWQPVAFVTLKEDPAKAVVRVVDSAGVPAGLVPPPIAEAIRATGLLPLKALMTRTFTSHGAPVTAEVLANVDPTIAVRGSFTF